MDLSVFTSNLSNPAVLIPAIIKEWRPYYKWEAFKEYYPEQHKVNSLIHRPDKWLDIDDPDGCKDNLGNIKTVKKLERVTRISIPIQKLITDTCASFMTGGGMSVKAIPDNEIEQNLYDAITKTLRDNKLDYRNSVIANKVLSELECAEIWYSKKRADGVIEMKCKIYYSSDGYGLIPVYDNYGDLIAFGLQYENLAEKKRYLDLYTDTELKKYVQDGTGWREYETIALPYGKIPVIYYSQPQSVWSDVQSMIDRMEKTISNYCDTNDYNGSPITKAKGDINGWSAKGETGKVLEMGENADVSYLTWDSKPEAIIYEKDTLMEFIFLCTQTPNLSPEALAGLGDISGVAFDRMMISAHLKAAKAHTGWYGEGIQRRLNFLKYAVSEIISTSLARDMTMTPIFNMFRIDDDASKLDIAMKANGDLPVMSQKDSIVYFGKSDDADKTIQEINDQSADSTPPDPVV